MKRFKAVITVGEVVAADAFGGKALTQDVVRRWLTDASRLDDPEVRLYLEEVE